MLAFIIPGVAFDAVGNLYIPDGNNNRIRKVDTNGIITTVVGDGPATRLLEVIQATAQQPPTPA